MQTLANDTANAPMFGLSDEQLDQVYSDVQNSKSGLINRDLYEHTRSILHQSVDKVFGDPRFDSPDYQKAYQLKQNLSRFAGFKSAWQTADMAKAGSKDEAHAINNQYNVNWLRTEYVHGVRASRSAKRWQQIQTDKDIYGFLRYMPSTAANPRNEHRRLYGVVKPVDSPFWDIWFPPSDWGCLCGTDPVRSDADTRDVPKDIKLPPRVMRNNPGKSGEIINDTHPMIDQLSANLRTNIGRESSYFDRSTSRAAIESSTKSYKNVVVPTEKGQIALSNSGVRKSLSVADRKHFGIITELPTMLRKAKYVDTRLPKTQDYVKLTHFYELPVKDKVYAVVWEGASGEKWFHSLSYKISGKKPSEGQQ